jgi:hypothetical protein
MKMKTNKSLNPIKMQLLILVLGLVAFAPAEYGQNSSIPAAFVEVGMGARPAAMGGAYSGLADDINAIYWNPSGLVNLKSKEASFTTAKLYGLIRYNLLEFGMPLNIDDTRQGIGFGLLYSGDDAEREFTLTLGYARDVGPVSVGANLKYRYASFGNNSLNASDYNGVFTDDEFQQGVLDQVHGSANGFGIDLGLLYQFSEKIRMGLMIRDLYSPIRWDSQSDSKLAKGKYTETVPVETVIGTSYKVFDELTVTADFQPALTNDVSNMIRGGAELRLFQFLYVRAGLQNTINNFDDEKYVLGFGFNLGVKKSSIKFDYTYLSEPLESSNRLTISFSF